MLWSILRSPSGHVIEHAQWPQNGPRELTFESTRRCCAIAAASLRKNPPATSRIRNDVFLGQSVLTSAIDTLTHRRILPRGMAGNGEASRVFHLTVVHSYEEFDFWYIADSCLRSQAAQPRTLEPVPITDCEPISCRPSCGQVWVEPCL
jgi:hypothetical protein